MSKRSNKDNLQTKSKIIRLQAENEIGKASTQGKTIFDLSDGSIEKIISYLRTVDDLLNIAEADHRFKSFATKAYKEMHPFGLKIADYPNEKNLRIIRYFGHIIAFITIDVDLFDFDIRILTEMKTRCRESLVALHIFLYGTAPDTEAIPGKEQWCQFLQSIAQSFTNLNVFEFRFDVVDEVRDIRQIIQHMPSLSTLNTSVNDIESLQRLILINRHLTMLRLWFRGKTLTQNLVNHLGNSLPQLTNLSMEDFVHRADINVHQQQNRRDVFNEIAILHVKPLNSMEINVFNLFAIRQNNLACLNYVCKSGHTESFINTLCQNRNLQQLFIGNITDEQLLQLARSLRRIWRIGVHSSVLTPLVVSIFLKYCPRLRFMWIDDPATHDLWEGLVDILAGSRWKMKLVGNRLHFSLNNNFF